MIVNTGMDSREYRNALKSQLTYAFDAGFGSERFGGVMIGNFFSITHYAEYEWNRRINNRPRNHAYGFIRKTDMGCQIRYLHTKGWMTLRNLLVLFALYAMLFLAYYQGWFWKIIPASLGLSVLTALVIGFAESFSEASEDGETSLMCLLNDPVNPYGTEIEE